jgi:hypothetical protein
MLVTTKTASLVTQKSCCSAMRSMAAQSEAEIVTLTAGGLGGLSAPSDPGSAKKRPSSGELLWAMHRFCEMKSPGAAPCSTCTTAKEAGRRYCGGEGRGLGGRNGDEFEQGVCF